MTTLEAPLFVGSKTPAARLRGFARWLFKWRTERAFRSAEWTALMLFAALAACTQHYHEAWDDEAQAWLIARDNSAWQIVHQRLHYEGAPPLWHLLLHIFHAVGGTYTGMAWISVALATAGMYVWLRWSPFPAVLRFLLPFTFFFAYQYAVIARSYVLVPLLTFALCVLFTKRRTVVWFALIAGLLANVSLQGFAMAVAITALYSFEIYRKTTSTHKQGKDEATQAHIPALPRNIAAGALFTAMLAIAIYCAIPAPDLNFAIGDQVATGTVHRILVRIVGETQRNAPHPPPDPPIIKTEGTPWTPPRWNEQPRLWIATLIYPRTPPPNHFALRWLLRTVGPNVLDFLDVAAWPIANSNLLAFGFLIAAIVWLRSRQCLRMLWPWLALAIVSQILWTAEHHAGMLLIALVAGLWLAAESSAQPSPSRRSEEIFLAFFAAVLVLQVAWTGYSVHAEVKSSYDPGPETARWLQQSGKPRIAAFGFATVSIQPWFPRSAFINVPTSWWQWSSNVEINAIHHQTLAQHPDVVVYGLEFPGFGQIRDQVLPLTTISAEEERDLPRDPIVKDLHDSGYRETHRLCGTRFARFSSAYRICDIVYEPDPARPRGR